MAHSIPSDSLTLSAGWSFGDLWPFLLKKQVITKQNSILIFEASGNPVYSINFSDQFLGRKIKRRTGVDDCFSTYVVSPDQCSHLSAANDISIVHFKWNCSDQSPRRRYRSGRRSIRILIAINNRRQTPTPPLLRRRRRRWQCVCGEKSAEGEGLWPFYSGANYRTWESVRISGLRRVSRRFAPCEILGFFVCWKWC